MTGNVLLVLRLLIAALLYGFLLAVFWLIWRDLRRNAYSADDRDIPALTLARRNGGAYRRLRFFGPEVVVGRDPTCGLQLDDKAISARHALISYHHSQWWLEDLRSTNGTFLNAEPVQEPVVVASGDRLRFGELEFDLTIEP